MKEQKSISCFFGKPAAASSSKRARDEPEDGTAKLPGKSPAKSHATASNPFAVKPKSPKAAAVASGSFLAPAPAKAPAGAHTPEVTALLADLTDPGWRDALAAECAKPYFARLAVALAKERASHKVFPPAASVFAAFNWTPLDQVRVVILGQDPYHNDGQAHGLCFSVQRGVAPPGSLKNIYTELEADVPGFKRPAHGNLEAWARRGVFLPNATLTVRAHAANSHAKLATEGAGSSMTGGWQEFTDAVIRVLSARASPVVFMLWGGFAQKKGKVINRSRGHHVIECAHPSPLSVTKWRGCQVFSGANAFLESNGLGAIDWGVPK